jgi:hypothetical protein
MKKRLKFRTLLILVAAVTFGASSYTQNVTLGTKSKYKTYSLKHYGVSFSFEYPVGYEMVSSYIQTNPLAATSVRFALASGIFGWVSTDPIINVIVVSSITQQQYNLKNMPTLQEGIHRQKNWGENQCPLPEPWVIMSGAV